MTDEQQTISSDLPETGETAVEETGNEGKKTEDAKAKSGKKPIRERKRKL